MIAARVAAGKMFQRRRVLLRTCVLLLLGCLPRIAVCDPTWTRPPDYVTPGNQSSEFIVTDDEGHKRRLYSKSYAILILEGKYKPGNSFDSVDTVAALAEQLLKPKLEQRGFKTFVWRDLKSRELKLVLEEIFSKLGYDPDARLFFYYFGHGHTISDPNNPTHDRTFLVPVDSPNPQIDQEAFEETALPITQMIQFATQSVLKHTFFAFEACKAGAIIKLLDGPPPPNPLGYILNPDILSDVHQFLTAGNELQNIPADNSFTQLLAGALSDPNADGNRDGYITGSEVISFVVGRLAQWKDYSQSPEKGTKPQYSTGDFIFGPLDPSNPGHVARGPATPSNSTTRQVLGPEAPDLQKRLSSAIEILGNKSNSSILHYDAIGQLQSLAREQPATGERIAQELALAALTYSTPHHEVTGERNLVGEISAESQAALTTIGSLSIMEAGLPLQLQLGNFRGARLSSAKLNGVDLSGSDLTGSDLYGAKLYNANLPYAKLGGANLAGALLSHAALNDASLCEAHNTAVSELSREPTVPVQLSGAKLDDAHLEGARLVGAKMSNSANANSQNRTDLSGAHFKNADLQGADLRYTLLDGSDLRGANLTDADLSGASVKGVHTDESTRLCRTIWADGRKRSESCPKDANAPPEAHTQCLRPAPAVPGVQPAVAYSYSVATSDGQQCTNGRIEKKPAGGWVELIPSGLTCQQQTMAYLDLGEDDAWFYAFDAARNMTARFPKVVGNVNWLTGKVSPNEAASRQWNVSQPVTRIPNPTTDSGDAQNALEIAVESFIEIYYQRNGHIGVHVPVRLSSKAAQGDELVRVELTICRLDPDKCRPDQENPFHQDWTDFLFASGTSTQGSVLFGTASVSGKIQFASDNSAEFLIRAAKYRLTLKFWLREEGDSLPPVERTFSVDQETAATLLNRRKSNDNHWSTFTLN